MLADLRDRFDIVLEALESEGDWVTNRVRPGKIILGSLGNIEAGVRQMIRTRPLEVTTIALPSGRTLRVPTAEETLPIKGFLIVRRNQTRDYLDVAALADRYGQSAAADILATIDDYYADQHGTGRGIAAQLARPACRPPSARLVGNAPTRLLPQPCHTLDRLGRGQVGLPGFSRFRCSTRRDDRCHWLSAIWPSLQMLLSPDGPPKPYRPHWNAVTSGDWQRIVSKMKRDPWGRTARKVEEVLSFSPYGIAEAMEATLARIRQRTETSERAVVAIEIQQAIARSGLTRREFAARIGTSHSHLSTYASGKVMPSAALMVRIRRLANHGYPSGRNGAHH